MPSRKIRSRKKRSRVVKKQSGKSKKKSVKKLPNRLRVKLPDLFSKVSLDPPLLKPKKGKPYQVTSSSIKKLCDGFTRLYRCTLQRMSLTTSMMMAILIWPRSTCWQILRSLQLLKWPRRNWWQSPPVSLLWGRRSVSTLSSKCQKRLVKPPWHTGTERQSRPWGV